MDRIITKYRIPIAVTLLLISFGGAYSYKNLSTSLFPNVTFPKIKIIADNGQQPVDKMMITVTKPLENVIKRIENLKLIRSVTSMGSCEISAFLDWNSDIDIDKQQIESRIAQIKNDLPPNVRITVEKMNPSILPIMGYSLQSDTTKNQVELKMIANYIVRPYLSRIEGVAAIEVIGGKTKEYQIILNQKKLSLLKLSPLQIINAIQQTGFIQSNGYVEDYKRLYLTVTDATIKNKEALENLVIFDDAKRKIAIKDVAKVQISEKTEFIKIKANGKNVPLIAILKQPNSNLIDVADQVTKKVTELNKILPKGVKMVQYYNQAEFVRDSLKSIIDVLWIGLVLAIIVVILFLRSFKASSVLLATIPITLGLTFIAMKALGYDLNIMTIGAIAASIGLIIDDAVIVVEQIHRTHEEHPNRSPKELVGKAIKFLFPAMVSSSLSTIVIFLPFVLMTGVAGAYFKILTKTMIITLSVSFFITWIGLPIIYILFSKKNSKALKAHVLQERKWVRFFIEKPIISYLFIGIIGISLFIVIPKLETGFLPQMDEGSIILDYNSPPGTSLEETNRILNDVDNILDGIPEVKAYSRRTGTQLGFFITEPNRGDYLIELSKKRHRTTEEVTDIIRKQVEASIPALTVDFGQVITDMLGDLMSSVQPIEIKIFGTNHEKLKELSKQVAHKVEQVKGTADVFDGIVIAGPIMNIEPKEAILKQYGLSSKDLQKQIQTYLQGTVSGAILEKEQLTNIRVLFPVNYKTPIEKIKEVKIASSIGNYYPLSTFADFSMLSGVAEIERENLQTMGVVTARLNNRDLGSVMKDIKSELSKINLPPSYQITYGGSYAEQQKSFNELLMILILGGGLVFIVVLFMFRNLLLSAIVIFTSILGVSGSIMALYLTHTQLNVGSYTGIIMIIGIIGEASIFTIYLFLDDVKTMHYKVAIIHSISARLRPKLMTAISAIVALMPLALGIGTGAQMHQPLAIAVVGGFVVALPLLLIVLPTLIYKFVKIVP